MNTALILGAIAAVTVFGKTLQRFVVYTEELIETNTNHDRVKWEEMAKRDIQRLKALGNDSDQTYRQQLSEMLAQKR